MKKIKLNILSQSSVQKAIDELNKEQGKIERRIKKFLQELVKVGIPVIDRQMELASKSVGGDGVESGSDTEHTTNATYEKIPNGYKVTLTLKGKDVLFVEYGAGVYYNGSVGQSPHPKGAENGFLIGSYGEGHGKQKTWYYKNDNGEVVKSHGTKATMPLYFAKNQIIQDFVRIAREVFG